MEFEVPIDVPDGWERQDALWRRNNPCLMIAVSPIANPALVRQCKALLDTGSHNTAVSPNVVAELGLKELNGLSTTTPDGQNDADPLRGRYASIRSTGEAGVSR